MMVPSIKRMEEGGSARADPRVLRDGTLVRRGMEGAVSLALMDDQQAMRSRPQVPDSVWSALVDVYSTGQRLVLERLDLAKLELIGFAREELVVIAREMARHMMLAVAGGILLIAGWFVLGWGLVNLAAAELPVAWRLVIDAGLNLAVGLVAMRLALRRRAQPERSTGEVGTES